MRLREIFEDVESDRQHRQEALDAYREMINIIEREGEGVFRRFANGFMADRDDLNHSEDIGIVILHDDTGKKVAGASPKKRLIFFFLDLEKPLLPQLKNKRQRTSFIHEYQHFIDHSRSTADSNTSDMDNDEYFNDPSETNAFYQQLIHDWEELWNMLPDTAKKNLLKTRWSTFNDWSEYVIDNVAEKDFINYLNSKNGKKLKKRLYQYWDNAIKGIS